MKSIQSHFEMHTRFRNGIFLLVLLMSLLIGMFYIYTAEYTATTHFVELTVYQKQIDSLKKLAVTKKKQYQLRPFNPNFITDYKGYQLGMSIEELDKLYRYRQEHKWINSVADFKKITGVSDSLLAVIAPLLKFPDWVQQSHKKKRYTANYISKPYAQKGDLNTITSQELQEKIGVPNFIAERIIDYRHQLVGFVDDIQLKDVKGLYDNQRKKILSMYTVKTKKGTPKIAINTASVKELMEVPYFDFETALEVKDFIEKNKGINALQELRKIEGLSIDKIDRIALYLVIN